MSSPSLDASLATSSTSCAEVGAQAPERAHTRVEAEPPAGGAPEWYVPPVLNSTAGNAGDLADPASVEGVAAARATTAAASPVAAALAEAESGNFKPLTKLDHAALEAATLDERVGVVFAVAGSGAKLSWGQRLRYEGKLKSAALLAIRTVSDAEAAPLLHRLLGDPRANTLHKVINCEISAIIWSQLEQRARAAG